MLLAVGEGGRWAVHKHGFDFFSSDSCHSHREVTYVIYIKKKHSNNNVLLILDTVTGTWSAIPSMGEKKVRFF